MKILSIDTASNICGVSILEDTTVLYQNDTNTGRTHSENLMPMIGEAFSSTSLTLKDIELIVCDIGPGSFTGIRIGVATVKAFSDSLAIPCIGISSLESLAYNLQEKIKENGFVVSVLDCKNQNCYFALYEKKGTTFETLIEPQAETVDSMIAILKSYCEDTLESPLLTFVGDGIDIYQDSLKENFPDAILAEKDNCNLNSFSLALAGLEHYSINDFSELLPLYLKKPQAQRQLEEKLKGIQ